MGYLESADDIDEIHPPVLEALRAIPGPDRQILELIYYEDLDYDEVSGETGLSRKRVKEREASGIEKLTHALQDFLPNTKSVTQEEVRKALRLSGERIIELSKRRLSEEKIESVKEEIENKIER
jgi:hypothetical protein